MTILSRLDPTSRMTLRFSAVRLGLFVVMAAAASLSTATPLHSFVSMLRLMTCIGATCAGALAILHRMKPDSDHLNLWDEALLFVLVTLSLRLAGSVMA